MSKKMLNFDFDTKALQKYYPKSNWRKAYDDVYDFLTSNGYEHRQGSGYITKANTDYLDVQSTLYEMKREFPWLKNCVNKMDVTNIGRTFDMTSIFNTVNDDIIEEIQSDELYLAENYDLNYKY